MNMNQQQATRVSTTSSLISGLVGTVGGLATQFQNRAAMDALGDFREQAAKREAEERARLGQLEFEEAMRRAREARREGAEIEAIGLRNAQTLRTEGRRIVSAIEARSAARGVRFGGSAAEVAAAGAAAAEFAATEQLRESSRRADALLFEAREVERLGRQRLFAGRVGAQAAILQGRFERASIAFQTPNPFEIIGSAVKPLRELPTAIRETLLTFKALQKEDDVLDPEDIFDPV